MNDRVLIFAGIIVGLAVADQLLSLHRLLKRRRAIVWDPLLLGVAALVMLTLVQVWWTLADTRSIALTIGEFLPILFGLTLLFLLAAASLPDESDASDDGFDLRKYYEEHQRYLWTLYTVSGLSMVVTRWFEPQSVQVGFYSVQNAIDVAALVLMATLIFVRNRPWQGAVMVALLILGPGRWLSITLA
jgi:hypothetical protein